MMMDDMTAKLRKRGHGLFVMTYFTLIVTVSLAVTVGHIHFSVSMKMIQMCFGWWRLNVQDSHINVAIWNVLAFNPKHHGFFSNYMIDWYKICQKLHENPQCFSLLELGNFPVIFHLICSGSFIFYKDLHIFVKSNPHLSSQLSQSPE